MMFLIRIYFFFYLAINNLFFKHTERTKYFCLQAFKKHIKNFQWELRNYLFNNASDFEKNKSGECNDFAYYARFCLGKTITYNRKEYEFKGFYILVYGYLFFGKNHTVAIYQHSDNDYYIFSNDTSYQNSTPYINKPKALITLNINDKGKLYYDKGIHYSTFG